MVREGRGRTGNINVNGDDMTNGNVNKYGGRNGKGTYIYKDVRLGGGRDRITI